MSKKKIMAGCLAAFLAGGIAAVGGICYLVGFRAEHIGDLARFLGARRFIESRYVGDVDDEKLMDGAISGMVQALGDPHSIYLDPEMYGQLMSQTEGSFGGIGVFAIPEMSRFYRHVLIEKRYPHHGAVAFAHCGRALFDLFRFLGVDD